MNERQLVVALKYLQGKEDAPQVVARGRGSLAKKILELARRHHVPVHRDSDLVQVLSRLELGDSIPPDLYKAVAEVLAFLYRMNRRYA